MYTAYKIKLDCDCERSLDTYMDEIVQDMGVTG